MANINMKELTKEQIQKLVACETAEELLAATKAEGLKNATGGRMPPCPKHRPCSEREWFAGW